MQIKIDFFDQQQGNIASQFRDMLCCLLLFAGSALLTSDGFLFLEPLGDWKGGRLSHNFDVKILRRKFDVKIMSRNFGVKILSHSFDVKILSHKFDAKNIELGVYRKYQARDFVQNFA